VTNHLRTTLYALPFLLVGISAAIIAVRLRRQDIFGNKWLILLLTASSAWSLAQAAEYFSTDIAVKIFWDNLQWVGIVFIPPAFLMLTLDFAGKKRWLKPLPSVIMIFMPLMILLVAYTNSIHHLFARNYTLVEQMGFISMDKDYLVGFWLFLGYSYSLFIIGFFHLAWLRIRSPQHYGNQVRWTILAALLAVIVSALEMGWNLTPHFHETTLAMCSFSLIVAWNMSKLRRTDFKKASGNLLISTIPDPVFLLSDKNHIMDLNSAAQNLIGLTITETIGKTLEQAAPGLFSRVSHLLGEEDISDDTSIQIPGSHLAYSARICSDRDNLGRMHGRILLLSIPGESGIMAAELQRTNALVQALGKVSAQVASESTLAQVFEAMGDELNKLSLEYTYVGIDKPRENSRLEYISYDLKIIKPLEKLVGQTLINFTLPRSAWPDFIETLGQYPVYISDFTAAMKLTYQQFPAAVIQTGFKLLNITAQTSGIIVPVYFADGTSGFIAIWGESLREQDLPAFSIFGNQISSAIEQARQLDKEKKQLQEVERSSSLVHALSQVSARASSSLNPHDILKILARELGLLGFDFYLCVVDREQQKAEIQFVSPNVAALRQVEKLFNDTIIGYKLEREAFPPLAIDALQQKGAVFVREFARDAKQLFYQFPDSLAKRGLDLVGIHDSTSGVHVAQNLQDGTTAILSIWGDDIKENDLPTLSVFGSQMASSFELTRLYGIEQEQAENLKRSNDLVEALSHVAANVASSTDPDSVMQSLGAELKRIGLECLVVLLDKETTDGYIRFHTMDTMLMKQAEKLTRRTFSEQRLPIQEWPPIFQTVFKTNQPLFIDDFRGMIDTFMGPLPPFIANRATAAVNIGADTVGYFLPLAVKGDVFGCLSIWNNSLSQSDLPTFSVFASQIAIAFENARLYEAEQRQSQELERSNTLLNSLSLISARVSSTTEEQDLRTIMRDELRSLGLDFVILNINREIGEAKIEYFSLGKEMDRLLEKITHLSVQGMRIPQGIWPEDVANASREKRTVFYEKFHEYLFSLFHAAPKRLLVRAFQLAGIAEDASGVFLPIALGDGTVYLICIWGNTIRMQDLPAFQVYTSQMESLLESARLYEAEQVQAQELEHANTLLNVLSSIAAQASSTDEQAELLEIMKQELGALDLEFTFANINRQKGEITIQHLSLATELVKKVQKLAGVTIEGYRIPEKFWPTEIINSYQQKRVSFIPDFSSYLLTIFSGINRKIAVQGIKLARIPKQTCGVNLPITLGDGTILLITIWGASIKEQDLPAFQVYTSQMESILENSRLFQLAEKEILERRSAQEALLISREEFRGLFENAHDAIIISDPQTGKILDANQRALDIYAYTHEEFTRIQIQTITENIDLWQNAVAKILQSKRHLNLEINQQRKDGSDMHMEVNAGIVTFQGTQAIQSIHRDVTERKEIEEKLRHETLHDALTGLPNRILFEDRLSHAIDRSARTQKYTFAVLFLDLDHFKDVNDSLGHLVGDLLLIDVSKKLQTCTRTADTIARMGGDEFVILLEDVNSIHEVGMFSERILDIITQPFNLQGHEIIISGSIGVVMGSAEYTQPDEYIRDGDIAMYRAKAEGRARFDIFNVQMRISVLKRLQLEKNLRKAIDRNEFFLLYQPIFSLLDQRLKGFETLIRWQQPDLGLISPHEFIPTAEDLGLIHELGRWALLEACTQFQNWNNRNKLSLNVNVSAVQLLRLDYPQEVSRILQQTDIDPTRLALEITETAFIHDQETAAHQIKELKALGVSIYLDDFGTGYSSLSFINQFQIDALKIDRQFISDLQNDKQCNLVPAIMALGERLGLSVIAEGIETEEQLDILRRAGCVLGQGYLYSKPISPEAAQDLIQSGS
jgi:diguanylate cyclase (GGDEF)-like protein/PAS domain S-box-containing protein